MADLPDGGASPPDKPRGSRAWERNSGKYDRPSSAVERDSALLTAALDYAERGWPVFPCNPKNKQPLVRADRDGEGKAMRGTGGVSKATTDIGQIRAWWRQWPDAMIGLAAGHGEGATRLFVLDFDPRHDEDTGEEWTLERLKSETEAQLDGDLPPTLAVRTPSGGVHLYLAHGDEGEPVRNRGNLPTHVDVRGLGGYVIAPPSVMADGRGYRWLRGDAGAAIAYAPAKLLKILRDRGGPPPAVAKPSPRAEPTADDARAAAIRKFGLAALDMALDKVRTAASGARNRQLYNSAFHIASLAAAGAVEGRLGRSLLEQAARDNPGRDDASQLEATIASGWQAGEAVPADLSDVGQRAGRRARPAPRTPSSDQPSHAGGRAGSPGHGGRGGEESADDLARACFQLPLTDLGNAERFRRRHGASFLYVAEWGWLAWDGRRWNRDQAAPLVARAVYDTVRGIAAEADLVEQSGCRGRMGETGGELDFVAEKKRNCPVLFSELIRKWGRASESAAHIKCIAQLAQPWLTARPQDFDADPLKVNLNNGTLHLLPPREGREARAVLAGHDPSDKITKLAAVDYRPEAASPEYDRFLARVQPEEDNRRFLHAWGGYNLTGDISAQKLVFNYGMGANGKSTWVDTVAFVAGDYGSSVRIETFLDQGRGRKGGDATPDLAALAGRRMVRTSEPERGSKFADALIKLVTGGEPLTVRELNMPFFEMLVTFKITISGNHRPDIGTDHGIWRRMRLMPWSVTIPEAERDDQLTERLKGEASGILNHLVAGAIDWLANGLPESRDLAEATEEYREQSDPLGRFVELCLERKAGARVQSTPLYDVYKAWCAWAGETEWKQKGFTNAMLERGFKKKQSNTIQWLDVELKRERSDFVDEQGVPRSGPLPGEPPPSPPPDPDPQRWDDPLMDP